VKLLIYSESIIMEIMTVMNSILCKGLIIVTNEDSHYYLHILNFYYKANY